jgi:hypothetical protein
LSSDKYNKLIKDKVSTWDKFKIGITPRLDVHERDKQLEDLADAKVREEKRQAELEALRRKRMNTPGTGQGQ